MALNWVMLDESKRPLPLPNENTVMTVDKGVDVVLDIPDTTGAPKKLNAIGRIWLTEQRLVFVGSPDTRNASFDSLSVPLLGLLSTSFVQPMFGANYLAIEIKPSPQGGLAEGTRAEIRLKDQPMLGFISTLEKVRERALYMKRQSGLGDDLPAYSSSASAPAGTSQRTTAPSSSRNTSQGSGDPPGYDMI